jgi:hypothetical protein
MGKKYDRRFQIDFEAIKQVPETESKPGENRNLTEKSKKRHKKESGRFYRETRFDPGTDFYQ